MLAPLHSPESLTTHKSLVVYINLTNRHIAMDQELPGEKAMGIAMGGRSAAIALSGAMLALMPVSASADTPSVGAYGIITDRPCTNAAGQSCVTGARDYAGETGGLVSSTSASTALPN